MVGWMVVFCVFCKELFVVWNLKYNVLLCFSCSCWFRCEMKFVEKGIGFVRRLWFNFILYIWGKLLRVGGMVFVSWLLFRNNVCRLVRDLREFGMGLWNWVLDRINFFKLWSFLNEVGIGFWKWLFCRFMDFKFWSLLKDVGSGFVRVLCVRLSVSRFFRLFMVVGMVFVKLL